jgi:precorrin-2 dehydrogenase/sirohydrochlorin ferrochelatase
MSDLPVMMKIAGRRCVVVGGGSVAVRRSRSLVEAGADVTVIAPKIDDGFDHLPVKVECGPYQTGDLHGALLVVVATNDSQVNQRVATDARSIGVLVNRADDPNGGDFVVPAHRRRGPITVAVSTDGISAAAAGTLVERCVNAVDDDWRALLETAGPWREKVQQRLADDRQRQALLRQLTDEAAMQALREGGVEGLEQHLAALFSAADRGA